MYNPPYNYPYFYGQPNYCPCCGRPLGYNPWTVYGNTTNSAINPIEPKKEEK